MTMPIILVASLAIVVVTSFDMDINSPSISMYMLPVHASSSLTGRYSSTIYVLEQMWRHGKIRDGLVIQFDEFFNYPNWQMMGEFKAWDEFTKNHEIRFEYIAYVPNSTQVAVKIVEKS